MSWFSVTVITLHAVIMWVWMFCIAAQTYILFVINTYSPSEDQQQ